ncbi:E3 ubiquitin-protein ligase RSL1-like [Impatiens glandulifera]|uniref:E3 ubiquitin-protein ligase RSL1-like n=1 Tax=Impatiens glandulifera TaxID=253017 RepID=UPI001FB0EA3F|nr:E3 ubiquitin-protein ligase RSL1-like [Impatiens glandulifera]
MIALSSTSKVKIEVDNTANIKCPGLRCDFNLDILSCRSILPVKLFEKWCDILFVKIILELDHCYCPNQKCTTLMVNECGGDVKRSICHNCKQAFCFKCKTSWHDGFDCEENEEIKDANDVAFGVLVEKNKWMRCPKCKFYVSLRNNSCTKQMFDKILL